MRIIFYLTILLPFIGFSQVNHWETVIHDNDLWTYVTPTSNYNNSWILKNYDDSNWNLGKGGFGFGDDDDSTVIGNTNAIFCRKKFIINDTSKIEHILLHIDYDDGFVAFLNGVEIGRENMGSKVFPAYSIQATNEHEANLKDQWIPEPISVSSSLLLNDTNILSVQVHNATADTGDITARVWLSLAINDNSQTYSNTPIWFQSNNQFFTSKLPLVFLNTNGQEIQDASRISCEMKIISNDSTQQNSKFDTTSIYNGNISIEIRGHSSTSYPKKQFGLETQDEFGENLNVSLFGWPSENDWILQAPYSDKTLLRNTLAFKISSDMGHYAPRTKPCELFINNKYQGVYVFAEKIKRDKGRVNISKLKKSDIFNDEVTGGYIFQIDRSDKQNFYWTSPYAPNNAPFTDVYMVTTYPKKDDIKTQQEDYIREFITEFEDNLASSNFDNPVSGYRNYINVPSFIDFFLVQEISRNADAYRLSSYFYKNRNKYDSLLHAGPVWDFNLSFGNADYCSGGETEGWAYKFNDLCSFHNNLVPFWWERLLEDEQYKNQIKCRWNELRTGLLKTENLFNWIDQQTALLDEAQKRNFETWNILNTDITGNNFVGGTYDKEIDYYKNWLSNRLIWMDKNMFGFCDIHQNHLDSTTLHLTAFPNPFTNNLSLQLQVNQPSNLKITIRDYQSRKIHTRLIGIFDIGIHQVDISSYFPVVSTGIYFATVETVDGLSETVKIIKTKN